MGMELIAAHPIPNFGKVDSKLWAKLARVSVLTLVWQLAGIPATFQLFVFLEHSKAHLLANVKVEMATELKKFAADSAGPGLAMHSQELICEVSKLCQHVVHLAVTQNNVALQQ